MLRKRRPRNSPRNKWVKRKVKGVGIGHLQTDAEVATEGLQFQLAQREKELAPGIRLEFGFVVGQLIILIQSSDLMN